MEKVPVFKVLIINIDNITYHFVYRFNPISNYDEAQAQMYTPFLRLLTSLNFDSIRDAKVLAQPIPQNLLDAKTIREWAFEGHISCESTFVSCKYRDEEIPCCDHFEPIYTEHGFCYAFNSRFKSTATDLEPSYRHTAKPHTFCLINIS